MLKIKKLFEKVFSDSERTILVDKKTGEEKHLLTPYGKGKKFAEEIRLGVKFTNKGEPKFNDDGSPMILSKVEQSYRAGYLAAKNDSAKIWKKKYA